MVPVLRPPPRLAGMRGALQPPHPAAPPRPPRRRREPGGSASGCPPPPPPPMAGVIGGPWPPHPILGATSPRDPPISLVRRLTLCGPGGVQPQGWVGSPQPGGQRRRPRSSGLGNEHLAARRDPGRGHGAARAPRGARVAYVASPAAAAAALAQAPAADTRRRPVLQAERALRAAARSWGAAALRRREGDAARRGPRGPPGIRQQGRPPLRGAGEVIHEKAVTVLWPHARRHRQAPGPRVAAVRRQVHQLQHDLVARRELRSR